MRILIFSHLALADCLCLLLVRELQRGLGMHARRAFCWSQYCLVVRPISAQVGVAGHSHLETDDSLPLTHSRSSGALQGPDLVYLFYVHSISMDNVSSSVDNLEALHCNITTFITFPDDLAEVGDCPICMERCNMTADGPNASDCFSPGTDRRDSDSQPDVVWAWGHVVGQGRLFCRTHVWMAESLSATGLLDFCFRCGHRRSVRWSLRASVP